MYVLNKPLGVVSTSWDPQGRPTVTDFAPPEAGRVYPGRPARHRLQRAPPDHERRRSRAPADAPVVRGAQDLPRADRPPADQACAGGGAAPRRGARRRHDRPDRDHAARARQVRDHAPRGTQPAGAPHVRRRRPSREGAAAHPVRQRRARAPARGQRAPTEAAGGRGAAAARRRCEGAAAAGFRAVVAPDAPGVAAPPPPTVPVRATSGRGTATIAATPRVAGPTNADAPATDGLGAAVVPAPVVGAARAVAAEPPPRGPRLLSRRLGVAACRTAR